MIAYLEGRLSEKHPTHVVIDVGGVGFFVHIPLSSYDAAAEIDSKVRLLTHLHVREDALALYGFATVAERDLFELLIGVSGIGPPMAQKILSGVAIADFKRLILSEDSKGLTRIKGIGQKLAQRLVMELKDKIDAIAVEDFKPDMVNVSHRGVFEEGVAALLGLGANPMQARKAVGAVLQELGDAATIELVIKRALRNM